VFSFAIADIFLVIRVGALYGRRKPFMVFLAGFYALAMISAIVNTYILTHAKEDGFDFCVLMAGCSAKGFYSFWIPFTIFDGVIMLLTLYKVSSFRHCHGPAVSLLARDSIVYFLVLFSTLVINLVVYKHDFFFGLMVPSQCIVCISISHMMMNIRGLVMDDPDNTVHLRTLKFAPRDGAGDRLGTLHFTTFSASALGLGPYEAD